MKKSHTNNYDSTTRNKASCGQAWRAFFDTAAEHWPQISARFVSDWVGIYKGSYLGTFWTVVMAIVPMSVYILLSILGIFPTAGAMPRAVYVSAGITVWMVIAQTITASIKNVKQAGRQLSGSQDPLIVGLISRYGILLSDTLIRFAALVAWMLISGVALRWNLLAFPLLLLPVLMFAMGLGLMLAAFNIVVPDIDPLTGMILRYAIFFSFAIFPLPAVPWVEWMTRFNISAQYVSGIREYVVLGTFPQPFAFGIACLVSLGLFLLGLRTFYRLEPHIVERL